MNALLVGGAAHGQVAEIPEGTITYHITQPHDDGFIGTALYTKRQYRDPNVVITYWVLQGHNEDLMTEHVMLMTALAMMIVQLPEGYGLPGVVDRA